MHIRIVTLSLLIIATPAVAHDFWIQPINFRVNPNAAVPFIFQVGHGKDRERWNNPDRILALNHFYLGKTRDVRATVRRGQDYDFVLAGAAPGLHVVAVQSNLATSVLSATRFNSYAREEGLVPILAIRKAEGKEGSPGRERYSRRAKTLLQVGPMTAASQSYATRAIGLKLEIVPERSPYALGTARILPLHVLYKGRRLPNATVKLTSLGADERPLAVAVTDRQGRAQFRIPAGGSWLVNVLWSEAVRDNPKIEFDTTFSSLTFGASR